MNTKSFLKPAMALAEEMGIPSSRFQETLWANTAALRIATLEKHAGMLEHLLGHVDSPDPSVGTLKPWLYVRARKYDETTGVMTAEWDHGPELLGPGAHLVEAEVGPTKVFASELQYGMGIKKVVGEREELLSVTSSLPAHLLAVEQNSAECYTEALRRLSAVPWGDSISRFERRVDVVCHDDHKSNAKAERVLTEEDPNTAKLETLCDAHKKAAVSSKSFDIFPSLPTHVIRLGLLCRGRP